MELEFIENSSIDLHCHTTASDGALSPSSIAALAKKAGLTHLAITDHDSVSGISKAQQAAGDDLQIIPGIELSALHHNFQVHIAGLFIDYQGEAMQQMVRKQLKIRRENAIQVGYELEKLGFDGIYLKVSSALPPDAVIVRGNYARWIFEHGYAASFDEALNTYLAPGMSTYITAAFPPMEQAIEAIKASGGLPILAHPSRYGLNNPQIEKLAADFKAAGGEGIEVSTCRQTRQSREFIAALSNKLSLIASLGSDFHLEGAGRDLGARLALPSSVTAVYQDPKWKGKFRNLERARPGKF